MSLKRKTQDLTPTRAQLENGLKVLVSESPRVPLVSINAFVLSGADQNPLESPGLASLTSRLLDEGTEGFSTHEIAELLENAAGSLSIFGQRELTGISLLLKSSDLGLGLELLSEIVCRPVFPEDRFQLERKTVLNNLHAMSDDPQTVASQLFNAEIYRGTPLQFPTLGTVEVIRRMTVDDVKQFHALKYAPQNTLVVVVGDIRSSQVNTLIRQHFGGWHNPQYFRSEMGALTRQHQPVFREHTMDKEQVNIYLGHLGITRNNPDYYALQVMDVILGGGPGFTSRIPQRLRDDQGLAYTTFSDICGSSGLYPGRFVAFISTSSEKREKALQGLIREISNLIEQGTTEDELALAQDFLTGSFVFDLQSNASVARFLLTSEIFALGADYLERYPEMIRSVSREDVQRVARHYLDTINYTTVIVGPR